MITVERDTFTSRLNQTVPILLKQFTPHTSNNAPGRFVRLNTSDLDDSQFDDHHLVQVLFVLLKLCTTCPTFFQHPQLEELATYAQSLLSHPHQWVRLSATQFIGHVLKTLDTKKLIEFYKLRESGDGYLLSDPRINVKGLILDLAAQLQVDNVNEKLVAEVISNLVGLGKIVKEFPMKKKGGDDDGVDLLWMVKRMRKVVFAEIAQSPSSYILVSCCLNIK